MFSGGVLYKIDIPVAGAPKRGYIWHVITLIPVFTLPGL